jgi:AcrR family transcriptional regulator
MPYRPTERTEARKAQTRERIVAAALDQLTEGGYASTGIQTIAARAGVATGTVYLHFGSKADLATEVFRRASARELAAVDAAAADDGRSARERVAAGAEAFARRALAGPTQAYALIAEPVDPAVEAERLQFRRAYAEVFAGAVRDGVAAGELPAQDADLAATAMVGAIGEALVGPLSPTAPAADAEALIAGLITFCLRATTGQEPSRDVHHRAA